MEIKVNPAASFDDERVVVEVTCEGWAELVELADRIGARPRVYASEPGGFSPALALDAMTGNYVRSRDKIAELEAELAEEQRQRQANHEWAARAEARAVEAEVQLEAKRSWAESLEAKLLRANRGHVCTENCKPNAHVAFIGRQRLNQAETKLAEIKMAAGDDAVISLSHNALASRLLDVRQIVGE